MVTMIGTPRKINTILLNINLNQRKLAYVCGHELATNQQNSTEKYLAEVKISQKVLGGLLFLTHTVDCTCSVHLSLSVEMYIV